MDSMAIPKAKSSSEQNALDKLQISKKGLLKLTQEEKEIIKTVDAPNKILAEHTKFVRKHLNIVMAVAEKLHYVKAKKLFRLKYNSFKEYVNEEFNYTRDRAYQLTAANEISKYINSQTNETILTTEPQCRELSKIKVYSDDEHQKVDTEKSNQKRLELIQDIMKKSQNKASTKDIVDAVRTELQKEADKLKQRPVKQRYNTSIEKFCDNVLKMMENIKKSQDLEADDFNTIKSTMLEKLQATFEQIKVMQSG
jgi:hypothetical protein